jgi:glycosyltransferase involved in cell wall biosynthesis
MQGPLVSIVMPAYKARDTIAGAVIGIVNQRYHNWELLIVDDGSPEDMEQEIKVFEDKRIRYIRLKENKGLANALNVGIDSSSGRFIARMDSDDYMEDWRIGDQVRFMMLEGLAICGTGAEKFGAEHGGIRNPGRGADIMNAFLMGNPFVHPTIMFDRQRLGGDLRYNPDFRCEEDYELWSRLITANNCANIDYATIRYRISPSSNANHPHKKKLNRIVLTQFCERMGVGNIVPVDQISEFLISGYIDEPGFKALRSYAALAAKRDLPRLGWLQGPLLDHSNYARFFAWLNSARQFSPYQY